MEELVQAVLTGVEQAKSKGLRKYTFILPANCCECNIDLQQVVRERLPNHVVNYMTVTYKTGHVEKRLELFW